MLNDMRMGAKMKDWKEMEERRRRWPVHLLCFYFMLTDGIHATSLISQNNDHSSLPPVRLRVTNNHVEIDNGIVGITLSNPAGMITSIGNLTTGNVLENRNSEEQRGYWDIVWSRPGRNASHFDKLFCTSFKVIAESDDKVEVSFTKTWDASLDNEVPLSIDKRYIVLRGSSGFYTYAVFEHMEGWPDLNLDEGRIAFKLRQDMFDYMVISDDKQRSMPSDRDREAGLVLDYQEAVLLTNPSNPRLKGQVDDKYQYSCDNKDSHVHGWISSNSLVGFWVITPNDEFRAGGPIKQDLTSHAGSTSLAVFFSSHYVGSNFGIRLRNGELWKKMFGPIFIYLNSGNDHRSVWEDAKRQSLEETKKWPYNFVMSQDFPQANHRGAISGRLFVRDKYDTNGGFTPANLSYVGLARPGDVGSWQEDSKGYQFWIQTDENGTFWIKGVRAGIYTLYAWVPGVIGDYKHRDDITIKEGGQVRMGNVVYYPPRNGPTLWEIGIPDRTAAEFYIPDPSPNLVNKLYINHTQKYRQYGLWKRYTDVYPNQDLIYTVNVSNYHKDWFFAHVNRLVNGNYTPTTWQILFNVSNVVRAGIYTLRLALASANFAEIQVRINSQKARRHLFSTGKIGEDNVIARHGIHGLYRLFNVSIPGFKLVEGRNTIYLRQAQGDSPFAGVLYDYIRLEAPLPRSLRRYSESSDVSSYTGGRAFFVFSSFVLFLLSS